MPTTRGEALNQLYADSKIMVTDARAVRSALGQEAQSNKRRTPR
jgi:hypothetical protein